MNSPSPQKVNKVWSLLQDLQKKKGITEIVINDPRHVFVERQGEFIQLNAPLAKEDIFEFIRDVAAYNKKKCDIENPVLDGNLPDGSRVNIITEPYAHTCPAITIRKYLRHIKSFESSPGIFNLGPKWVELLQAMVQSRLNIVVSGGTGVGKTTFLNLLLQEVTPTERTITIEDTLELNFKVPNMVRLETRSISSLKGKFLSVREMVRNTLRMRPDRIIIGEVRGEELFDLLQAMNTGHEGSMTSIHSNSPKDCLSRMESLFLLAGHEVPMIVVRRQICSAVDFIIQLGRDREGNRIVTEILELTEMEGETILCQSVAKVEEGELSMTGIVPKCLSKIHERAGLPMDFFNT